MEVVNLVENNEMKEEIVQLLIENNVLAVEKKAESEAELWKGKFKQLEIQISIIGLSMSPETRGLDGVASDQRN